MRKKAEILSPAGSLEALRAAVCNGADAVYLGCGDFNARRLAKNFTERDLAAACDYCRKRGVKVYVTVNTHITDREAERVEALARSINRAGADAVIVADFGVARIFRSVAPELALHASTQMTVHNLEGVKYLASLGFSRVVLARELTQEEIRHICKESPVEIEVFVHGALCMCYSGQCEMSAVIGRRSGNRGLCAQPCRMQYKLGEAGANAYPLSLRDLCLADYITELSDMGVASLKIEGRMKRPEYVALVTGIYSRILREGRAASDKEKQMLYDIFSRDGFTEGYYKGKLGKGMFGIRGDAGAPEKLLSVARRTYEKDIPEKTAGVELFCIIEAGRPALLAAIDDDGNRAAAEGKVPEPARNVPLTHEIVETQLKKTGGTGYAVNKINIKLGEGLSLPLSELNSLRRECLSKLPGAVKKDRPEGTFNSGFRLVNRKTPPRFTVSVQSVAQISDELLARDIAHICIPLCEFDEQNICRIRAIAEKHMVYAAFPRIIKDTEVSLIRALAEKARDAGITCATVGNTGHIALAKELGFETLRADLGINIFNSYALREIRHTGVESAMLSPELTLPQIRGISKIIDTEIVVYGRLPLMICENCVVQAQTGACVCQNHHTLSDRTGASFPLMREFNHRTLILNSQKLFLADKKRDYETVGAAYARLYFTSENSRECVQVYDAYANGGGFAPHEFTRGLYYRGVE
ncbi:MAG: U32 family peptidase [Oscillospiraceae bacterium]|nr:U32 family peptidase [Oscillospiraceae bacterium]